MTRYIKCILSKGVNEIMSHYLNPLGIVKWCSIDRFFRTDSRLALINV